MSTAYECSCQDSYEAADDDLNSQADTKVGIDEIEDDDGGKMSTDKPRKSVTFVDSKQTASTKPVTATASSQTEDLADCSKSGTKRGEVRRIRYGADLSLLRVFEWPIMPYPDRIVVPRMLPDGLPGFNVDQIFGQLPEYIEISLELLTKKRQGFATRFVIDPTVDVNILQMEAIDEFSDPPERIARKVIFVIWCYLQ